MLDVQIRCQRCGTQMELRDPAPGETWPPQQFWECPACNRHFWTTYPPPKKPAPKAPPKPAASAKPDTSPDTSKAKKIDDSGPQAASK